MRIRPGASIRGIQPETVIALLVLEPICMRYGFELVLTEATGGKHKEGSLHPVGFAVDTRGKALIGDRREVFVGECRLALGQLLPEHSGEFDFVDEHTADGHFHTEYQPD